MPPALVVVVRLTGLPAPVVPVKVTVTPGIPGSPASCWPLPFTSLNTKSPNVAGA